MNNECQRRFYHRTLLFLLMAAVLTASACTNPEKAKSEYLSKGEAYLKEEKFQEASIEFRNAIQIDDKLAAGYWGLARAYEGMHRGQEFFEALRKTVELDPNHLDSRVKLGNYYLLAASTGRQDFIGEAERLAKEILEKDPNHIEGHILMGSVLFSQHEHEKAFAELNRAIELDPRRIESYLSLAKFYVVTKDHVKAEEVFKRAISMDNNSPLAHSEYGKYLVQVNRSEEAEAQFRKAVEVAPSDKNARFTLASFYLARRQLDKAEESYKALAALDGRPENQATLADFYSFVNRTDEAIKIYQDILAASPDYVQGRYRLGEILLTRGDKDGAVAQIDEVLKRDQYDRQALLLRARVKSVGGHAEGLKAAIEDLKEVLRQEPNSRAGLYFIAQAHLSLGVMEQARAFAGDLERNYPDYLPAKLMQVQINLAAGDPRSSLRLASELVDRLGRAAPDRENSPQLLTEIRAKTYLARGAAQMQIGNIQAARQDFTAARDAAPRDPDPYINLAAVSMAENKVDEATGFYENALSIDPTNFNALSGLINLYARQKELSKAHSRIDQVLSAYPTNATAHYLKAQVYGFEGNAQGAEASLRKTLELDADHIAAYSALGALFINTKQEDRALAEFRRIVELRPDNASAYTIIGMLEDARKNYDAAADNYRKAIERDQNAAIAANNLAWLYAVHGKGNLDEAVRLAQGVVQKNPNIAGFIDTLGWVYYKKGLYVAAVEQLRKAVSVDETAAKKANSVPSPSYRYHLGMALKEKGDTEAAKRELQLALQLGEKTPFAYAEEARRALGTL